MLQWNTGRFLNKKIYKKYSAILAHRFNDQFYSTNIWQFLAMKVLLIEDDRKITFFVNKGPNLNILQI